MLVQHAFEQQEGRVKVVLDSSALRGGFCAPMRVEAIGKLLTRLAVHDLGGMHACPNVLTGQDVILG